MSSADAPSFAFPEGVLAREVDGEMVLLNLESEQYYGLDPVGANIVTRLTRVPEHEALAALNTQYDVDPAVLESDVKRLVAALVDAGLLERRDGR